MLRFILRRTAYSFLILIGILILTFVLFRMAAGDPVAPLLGKNPRPEEVERLRADLGVDRPLFWGKWRLTEAYTTAVFEKKRVQFQNVSLSGTFEGGRIGVVLGKDAQLAFRRNFIPDGQSCRVEIDTDKPLLYDGKLYEPSWGNVKIELPDRTFPEEIIITVPEDGTTVKQVTFSRQTDTPFDSQLYSSLKEIISFQKTFPYISVFNFGKTLYTHESIRGKLWRGMGPSLLLMLPIFFGELFFGLVFAMISCVFRGTWVDRVIVVLSVAGMSISYLALIIFGQWLLGYYWNWFPVWGWGSLDCLFLPVIIGIISGTGSGVRFYRTVFLNEINREYLRTAAAKGVPPLAVYGKHLFRNSLIPVITRASGVLPFLFTGSLLLESFFGIPGLGSAGINALHDADLQMLKALVLLSSFLFVVINLLTDIAYAFVDPRMRPEK